jgi:tenascin
MDSDSILRSFTRDNPAEQAYCKCVKGWTGKSCSMKQCPKDCSGRGICSAGVCFCKKGYYGEDCALDASALKAKKPVAKDLQALLECKNTCRNGKCLLTRVHPTSGMETITVSGEPMMYQCLCEASWGGVNCDVKLDRCPPGCIDEEGNCAKSCVNGALCPAFDGLTCSGRGECQNDGTCKCADPFVGKACETTPCPLGCSKRGYCNSKTHKCLCPAGWGGTGCEKKLFDTI